MSSDTPQTIADRFYGLRINDSLYHEMRGCIQAVAATYEQRIAELESENLGQSDLIATLQAEMDAAYRYARTVFGFWHPECAPLPDLMGVLSQIDNASTSCGTIKIDAEIAAWAKRKWPEMWTPEIRYERMTKEWVELQIEHLYKGTLTRKLSEAGDVLVCMSAYLACLGSSVETEKRLAFERAKRKHGE